MTRRHDERGQSLVEFAIIVPLFLFLLFALIEFAFAYNATLAANYATRDGALIAAEAGDAVDADCVILMKVDEDMSPPVDRTRIQTVKIFRSDNVGVSTGEEQVYTRGGTTTCGSVSVPYTLSTGGYPPSERCNVLNGETCPSGRTTVDQIGVEVTYQYQPHTPMAMPFLGVMLEIRGSSLFVVKSNIMRMEPIL